VIVMTHQCDRLLHSPWHTQVPLPPCSVVRHDGARAERPISGDVLVASGAVLEGRGLEPTDRRDVAVAEALRALRAASPIPRCARGVHLCAAPPPGRAVQRFGLHLMWLFWVLGGHHLPLAAQDLSTPMAQILSDAVVGPATFTHVRVGVRMHVRMKGPLDLISFSGRLTRLVVCHSASVASSSIPARAESPEEKRNPPDGRL
jgi:hypothetical protein